MSAVEEITWDLSHLLDVPEAERHERRRGGRHRPARPLR